jgi:hypothetical protein
MSNNGHLQFRSKWSAFAMDSAEMDTGIYHSATIMVFIVLARCRFPFHEDGDNSSLIGFRAALKGKWGLGKAN